MTPTAESVLAGLASGGIAVVRGPIDEPEYRRLAGELGAIVGEEVIALRDGAHAYVAKPGAVPPHTDHPDVAIVAWWCEEQDETDGASHLLDARPIIESLSERERAMLRQVELWCPPLAGGPPTLRFPVLRPAPSGDAIFCSPWLRSTDPIPLLEDAIERFRGRLIDAAKDGTQRTRLAAGDALFVDNRRVLHGRDAISDASRRRLRRLWVGTR